MESLAGAGPIRLTGQRPTGILLLHGLTGTPEDLRPLATALGAAGYAVIAPCLPGHEGNGLSLARQRWGDWYAAARAAAGDLGTPRLVVCGLSLGALLGTVLADREREWVIGLIALAPALEIRHQWLLPLLPRIAPLLAAVSRETTAPAGSAVAQRMVRLSAAAELYRAQQAAREALPRLRLPTLIIHSRQDPTCPLRSALRFEHGLTGAPTRLVVLERSGHVLPQECEKEAVTAAVLEFCDEIDREASKR